MRPFQHWRCESCKGYNDVLNNHCSFCKTYKPQSVSTLHQMLVEIDRGIFDDYGILSSHQEGRVKNQNMTTPNEELYAKFFNEETLLVQGMSDADLEEHIQELESIAREAKARIMAGRENTRTRTAGKGNKAWKVEPLGPDPSVTDSLNKVKQRSARMSRLDKMRNQMSSIGIPDSEIEQMMSKMIAQARKDPAALREEVRLKGELKEPQAPTIITEEQREQQIANRKALDAADEAELKKDKILQHEKAALEALQAKQVSAMIPESPFAAHEAEERKKKALAQAQALFGPNIIK